jgi:hypothetical protein
MFLFCFGLLTLTFQFKKPSHTLSTGSLRVLAKKYETLHGRKVIDVSPAALKTYEKTRRAKCLICPLNGKGSTFVGK